jgi:carbamoyltransferase
MIMTTKPTLAIYGIKDRNSLQYPAFVHDHNLCLMQGGKVLQYLQLERYTRRKYDNRLDMFLEELIDSNLLELPDEFDLVSVNDFVGNAFISRNGRIRIESPRQKTLSNNLESAYGWFQYSDWNGKK